MGTRSLTHIYAAPTDKVPLLTIYRQFDGHLDSMGEEIKACLAPLQLVNGFGGERPQANGMGCAAAQLVAALKDGCGNVYIYPAGSKGCGEEFTYRVYPAGETFRFVAEDGSAVAFDGEIEKFDSRAIAVPSGARRHSRNQTRQ